MNAQQPGQVRRAQVVRVQKVLQGVQCGHVGRVELRVSFFVIFNQAAEQVKIILLIWRQFVAGHRIGDFRCVFKLHLVVDRAPRERSAQPSVVFGQVENYAIPLCRVPSGGCNIHKDNDFID